MSETMETPGVLTLNGKAYVVLRLLGRGKGGYTWLTERDGLLYYVDYECNPYMEEWSFEHWGVRYWARTAEFDAYAREHGDL